MQQYQDTETGQIHVFEDGIDPFTDGYRSIPTTLSATIKQKLSEEHVWLDGDWIHMSQASPNYIAPISSVLSYDPAWHAFLQPYTWVLRDGEDFVVTLEQVNANSYAGEMLSEPVASFTAAGVSALISRDGAFALPMQGDLIQQHRAVEALNRLFCALLIGGISTEFVAYNQALAGSLKEDCRLFVHTPTLHGRIRHMDASIAERIVLMHPRAIRVSHLQEALAFGMKTLALTENLSASFLLHGYTALCRWSPSEALSSLWIVVEQLTSLLWETRFLRNPKLHPVGMKGRLNSMKQDNRTWTTSVKHELLWQINVLTGGSYASLSNARAQRNRLVHEGCIPDVGSVTRLWPAVCEMLEAVSGVSTARLANMGTWTHRIPKNIMKTNFDNWNSLAQKTEF